MPIHIKKEGKYDSALTPAEEVIVASFTKHIKLMFADDWYITIEFATVEEEAMETEAKPEYRTASITVDMTQMEYQEEYIDKFARHELLHILTWSWFGIAGTLAYKNAGRALEKIEEAVIDRLEHMPAWEYMYKGLAQEKQEDK